MELLLRAPSGLDLRPVGPCVCEHAGALVPHPWLVSVASQALLRESMMATVDAVADCLFVIAAQTSITPTVPPSPVLAVEDATAMLVVLRERMAGTKGDLAMDSISAALFGGLLYALDLGTGEQGRTMVSPASSSLPIRSCQPLT